MKERKVKTDYEIGYQAFCRGYDLDWCTSTAMRLGWRAACLRAVMVNGEGVLHG